MTAPQFKRIVTDFNTILQKRQRAPSVMPSQDDNSDMIDSLNSEEAFDKFLASQADKVARYQEEFPAVIKEVPCFADCKDIEALQRMMTEKPREEEQNKVSQLSRAANAKDIEMGKMVLTGSVDAAKLYTWDMCMVFKIDQKEEDRDKLDKVSQVTGRLKMAGLNTFMYFSVQRDELYCLIGINEHRLKREAERTEFEIRLDPKVARKEGMDLGMKSVEGDADKWAYLYGKFVYHKRHDPNTPKEKIYYKWLEEGEYHPKSPFRQIDRMKLIVSIIGAEQIFGGSNLAVRKQMLQHKVLVGWYPLHDYPRLQNLEAKLTWLSVFNPPLDDIKDYFGEQFGMYFAFLSLYTRSLVLPAAIGLGFAVAQAYQGNIDIDGLYIFGFIICIWSTTFIELVKRESSRLRVRWGMDNFADIEAVRPEFSGEMIYSTITGKHQQYFPSKTRTKKMCCSYSSIGLYIAVLLSAVTGTFVVREVMKRAAWSSIQILVVASILNAVVINVFNFMYGKISVCLNNMENHETDSANENALIIKTFSFKLFNAFNVLLIIAFVKSTDLGFGMGYCRGSFEQALNAIDTNQDYKEFLNNFEMVQKLDQLNDTKFYSQFINVTGKNTTQIKTAVYNLENNASLYNTLFEGYTDLDGTFHDLGVKALQIAIDKKESGGTNYRGDCMYELALQLFIIFMMGLFLNNLLEIGIPLLKSFLSKRAQASVKGLSEEELQEASAKMTELKKPVGTDSSENSRDKKESTQKQLATQYFEVRKSTPEREFEMVQHEGTFGEYDEMVIQFGYVILFVVACPLTPFLALINNIVEFRLDSQKLLKITRRPHPKGAQDLGNWETCLSALAWLGLVTNTGLILLTSKTFESPDGKDFVLILILFVCIEHSLFFIKFAVAYYIPDEAAAVSEILQRQKFLTHSLHI